MANPKFYTVISGVGSGTGHELALRFAKSYSVVVLARRAESYVHTVDSIKAAGGYAVGISCDANDPASVDACFNQIALEFPSSKLAAAIYNAGGSVRARPFLDIEVEEYEAGLQTPR